MQLPPLVTARLENWQRPVKTNADAAQELSDWVWEKWNAGQWAINLPSDIQADAVALKRRKDTIHPSGTAKIAEELLEAAEAAQVGFNDEIATLGKGNLNKDSFELLQHILHLPIRPVNDYMTAAIKKLEGRVALNEIYPEATSKAIKAELAPYEKALALNSFSGVQFGDRREREIRESLIHKAGCACKKCKKTVDLYNGELHHRDPNKKKFGLDQATIKRVLRKYGHDGGMVRILDEFKKTMLLCRDCHKEVHRDNLKPYFDKAYWPYLDRPKKRENRRLFNTRRLDDVA